MSFLRWIPWAFALCWVPLVLAETGEDVASRETKLTQQRAQLAQRRAALVAQYDRQERSCWQRFAVNDCLRGVRRAKRADIKPIDEADWALAEEQRALVQEQRRARLADKVPPDGEGKRP